MTPAPAVLIEPAGEPWLTAAAACLNPEEESKASRFRHPDHRDTWRAGRAWVRHHLAAALETSPGSLVFATNERGRPHLVGVPAAFDANWSHAGHWMALAISRHSPVGIDIEIVRPDFPHLEVEASVCTAAEHAALDTTPDADTRRRLFFRLWTAKEALMKATGLGAALDPALIDVRVENGMPIGYTSHPGWQLHTRESQDWIASWAWPA
jgi:4'-phosphopantetheinyl transferase